METNISNLYRGHTKFLDGWRGLAVLGVMYGHFIGVLRIPFTEITLNAGRFGVDMFFSLSGLLIGEILFQKKSELDYFYYRRFTRIIPTYYIFILLYIISTIIFGMPYVSVRELFAVIFFYSNYIASYNIDQFCPDLRHTWSLCVEEHSYLILSLFAFCSRKKIIDARYLILFSIIVSLCFIGYYEISGALGVGGVERIYWRTEARIIPLFSAALFGLILSELPKHYLLKYFSTAFLACGVLLNFSIAPDYIKYTLGSLFLSFGLSGIRRSLPEWRVLLEFKPLLWFGYISFSLYLIQQPFHGKWEGGFNKLMMLVAIALSVGMYFLWESRVRVFLNQKWSMIKNK
jgi:peptidoglycan/LPS O-acetylase OafA/YrhL